MHHVWVALKVLIIAKLVILAVGAIVVFGSIRRRATPHA